MPCLFPLWLFLCLLPAINADLANAVPPSIVAVFYLLPACVCRQVVARSFLSGALRPFHVCPSPQTGNGHAHNASRNVDRCSKMVCFPGDFRCFLIRLSNVHCPPGNVFLSTYQCLPVYLSMLFCPLINVSSSIYPPSFKFSLRFFYVNIFHLLTSFHDVLFFHVPYFITFPIPL